MFFINIQQTKFPSAHPRLHNQSHSFYHGIPVSPKWETKRQKAGLERQHWPKCWIPACGSTKQKQRIQKNYHKIPQIQECLTLPVEPADICNASLCWLKELEGQTNKDRLRPVHQRMFISFWSFCGWSMLALSGTANQTYYIYTLSERAEKFICNYCMYNRMAGRAGAQMGSIKVRSLLLCVLIACFVRDQTCSPQPEKVMCLSLLVELH